ncbi:MAG TPA: hypothetical protein EYH45_07350 [Candidatus Caldiarchaeum subterraneum]|uniref:Blue (type 1) copper domain-containing protein n=1 Tax=Caldiarchaeum subterraneum TaxID=311458 RepID=A0A833EAB9_CALS0|nr:hypothetical protein [Aigarchaeota archaeon]HIQ30362.1 hypothetical protein [Candidatus Caldarchaeum subterraneum]
MDDTLVIVGVLLFIVGLAGIYIAFSGASPTLKAGLEQFSGLVAGMGILFIVGGLFRGGLPSLGSPKVAGVLIVFSLGIAFVATTAALQLGPFKPAPEEAAVGPTPVIVRVSIIPGSFNPQQEDNYIPKNIRVIAGYNSTVVWTNDEEVPVAHTVTSEEGIFDSGLFNSGESWNYTFTRAGIYRYFCIPHPWMRGSVVVEEVSEEVLQQLLAQLPRNQTRAAAG